MNTKTKIQSFSGTEIWAPIGNYCRKKGDTPEIFIRLYRVNFDRLKEGLVIAIPKRTKKKNYELVHLRIEAIRKEIPPSNISQIERYWAPGKGFPNRIEDMGPNEMKKIVYGKSDKK